MIKVNTKPMSVNDCWKGHRYKTKHYTDYETILKFKLPKLKIPIGKLKVTFIFGLTSCADIDNPLKPLIDIMQKRYHFDDKEIYELSVIKIPVKNGQQFFEFKIESYFDNI